jgi:hypothetical protein
MTPTDRKAFQILTTQRSGKAAALKALAKEARREIACPECGDEGPHEDNGCTSRRELCCRRCGLHFEA